MHSKVCRGPKSF